VQVVVVIFIVRRIQSNQTCLYSFILQTNFATPEGTDPVAIRMTGMGKGMVWINGKSIGRHWMSYLSPLGQPTQSE